MTYFDTYIVLSIGHFDACIVFLFLYESFLHFRPVDESFGTYMVLSINHFHIFIVLSIGQFDITILDPTAPQLNSVQHGVSFKHSYADVKIYCDTITSCKSTAVANG